MKSILKIRLFILLLLAVSISAYGQDQSAYDVWNEMTEAMLNNHERRTLVKGTTEIDKVDDAGKKIKNAGQMVMFGGEKEGSSALITRIMGPDKSSFKEYVNNLPEPMKKEFLTNFLTEFSNGKIRMNSVIDVDGNSVVFDLDGLKGVNYSALSPEELDLKLDLYLDRGGDKHLSHIKKQVRMNIFNGKYGGLTRDKGFKKNVNYGNYKPLHGKASKFVVAAHGTGVGGWEMNFEPQRSYGEFEHMIDWFREELKNVGKRFEAPGHQWIVYPKSKEVVESSEKAAELIDKVGEVQKNSQAYIVLKSVEGNAGIELSSYKDVQPDTQLLNRHDTGRGVIRLENNRFKIDGQDAFAIEYRAGVKSDKNRRKTQKFLISRYAANEFDDLASGKSWSLTDNRQFTADELKKRFNVSGTEAKKFLDNLDNASINKTRPGGWAQTKKISHSYLVPLWNWENAPYISANKKLELKQLTRSYIKSVASMANPEMTNVRKAMSDWAKVSRVSHDIEAYLKPKQKLTNPETAHIYKMKGTAAVDVNKIDFGIEYSARFPLKTSAEFTEVPGQQKKFEWQNTLFDYNTEERKKVIRDFAKTLGKELNDGVDVPVVELKADGHGHGLDIAFEVKDKEGRKWRAEWDGIGRNYDLDSKMISESVRGGHVEIVTPKFVPTYEDKIKLFTAMDKQNLLAQTRFGGGHVNIDLKPFEGKPKKMARFIGTYLDNRNVMSMLFQHPGRQIGAEAYKVSPSVIQKLKNFNGSEEDLKKLLYNEKFYNTRVGRKTKNSQLNLIAYFQDVVPEEFIHEDFDMKNDTWRKTFDVQPKIRKMEFRMFNAARNPAESALQIKFSKALLNKALNESDEVFKTSGVVDYVKMAKNPELAFIEFEKTMKDLGLNPDEYKGFFVEGMEETRNMIDSPRYVSVAERLKMHPEVSGWKEAVNAREVPIPSEGRKWAGEVIIPEAKIYAQRQMVAREAADATRGYSNPLNRLNRKFDKLPLEISMGIDELKTLPKEDQLLAMYYQKSKIIEGSEHKKLMKSIVKSDDFSSFASMNLSVDSEQSRGFANFIADQLPEMKNDSQKEKFKNVYEALLNHSDPEIRSRGIDHFLSWDKGANTLLDRAYSSIGVDPSITKEILKKMSASKGTFSKEAINSAYLKNLASYSNDPAVIGSILKLSAEMDESTKIDIFKILLKNDNPKFQQIGLSYLEKKSPVDFYAYGKEVLINGSLDPSTQKKIASSLNNPDLFKGMKIVQLDALGADQKLLVGHKLLSSPTITATRKASILTSLNKIDDLEAFNNAIRKNINVRGYNKWLVERLENSEAFNRIVKNKGLTVADIDGVSGHSLEERVAFKQTHALLAGSDDPYFYNKSEEMLAKVDNPSFTAEQNWNQLYESQNPNSKMRTYNKMLSDKKLLSEMRKNDLGDLSQFAARDIANDPNLRFKAAQVLAEELKTGSSESKNAVRSLLMSNDPITKRTGLYLYGSTASGYRKSKLQRFLSDKNISVQDKKIIKSGIAKHDDFIKNLKNSDLKKLSTEEKLLLVFEKSKQGSIDDLLSGIKKDKELLAGIDQLLFDSQKSEDLSKWLVGLTNSDELTEVVKANPGISSDIAEKAFMRTKGDYSKQISSILAKADISPTSFSHQAGLKYITENHSGGDLDINKKFMNLLESSKVLPSSVGDDSQLHEYLLSALVTEPDAKTKTRIAGYVKDIPGSTFDKELLKSVDKLDKNGRDFLKLKKTNVGRQFSVIAKSRTSEDGLKVLKKLETFKDPIVSSNAKKGILSYINNAKTRSNLDGLDFNEKMSVLYRKSTEKPQSLTSLFKQVKDSEKIVEMYENSSDIKMKKWLLASLADKENSKALGISKEQMKTILKTDIGRSNQELSNAALKVLRDNPLLSNSDKIDVIYHMPEMTNESLDTLKLFANKAPKDKRFVEILNNILVDTYTPKSVKTNKKAAELMMMLPTNSVEKIVKYADNYLYNDSLKSYILLGASKQDSAVIADYAKKNLDSSDPVIKRTANKIADKWNKKSSAAKLINRSQCVGRSIKNVLNRLTFR